MSTICETIMLVCFGLSWPFAVMKSLKSKSAKGKSILFQSAILLGYLAGIMGKVLSDNYTYVFWLYILNTALVAFDTLLYFRNAELDRKIENENKALLLDIDLKEDLSLKEERGVDDYPEGQCLASASLATLHDAPLLPFDEDEEEGMSLARASLTQ